MKLLTGTESAQQGVQMNWQPMSTAPKDREILLWYDESATVDKFLETYEGEDYYGYNGPMFVPEMWAEIIPPTKTQLDSRVY